MKGTALYTIDGASCLCILIPKLRGEGYVKSPFGGHHSNEKYHEILKNDLDISSIADIDGYVNVSFYGSVSRWTDTYPILIIEVLEHFERVFPRIEKWEELSHTNFMDIVIRNSGHKQ